jgi:hypothetical protein
MLRRGNIKDVAFGVFVPFSGLAVAVFGVACLHNK